MKPPPDTALWLEVGRVVRPHGLRGEVVVELTTNRAERMRPGATLAASSSGVRRVLEVQRARPLRPGGGDVHGLGRWVVAFAGVDGHDEAEALRDTVLAGASLDDGPVDDEGDLWVHHLVGARVVDAAGAELGVVDAVEANPASDLLVLDRGALIPLRFVTSHGPGRVTVDLPPGLLEL